MRAQMVRSLVSTCLVATSVVAQPALAGEHEPNEVPFELYQHHLIVTRGSIGGLDGLSLLIDTGSIPSMVDGRIARKLNLQAEPSMLVAFGQSVPIQSAVLDGFRIGPVRSGPVPAGVGDLSYLEGVRIDAIVGLDVLARTSFSIDYRTRVLRFAPTGHEDWVAPLELAWPFLTVRMTIAGQPVRLLVDTGSSDIVLFKSRLPPTLCNARWRGDKTVRYASGAARLQRLDLRQVGLGGHVWDKLEGWALDRVADGYPMSIDGVLGVRSLGCTRVRFDFERNELGCSGMRSLANTAAADRRDRASRQALAFFAHVGAGRPGTFLEALRPLPLAADLRAQVMASLPMEGEVRPSEREAHKLAAIEPVLRCHHRQDVLQLKLITVGHAFVGLHARTVLLVSREALDLLDGPQLQALIGHEIGHEYFWDEYQGAVARDDQNKVRELELRCDGVAIITLRQLGLDPHALVEAVRALTRFNESVGAVASAGSYASLKDRIAFVETIDGLVTSRLRPPSAPR